MVVSNLFFWFKKTRPVYFGERPGPGPGQKTRKIAALRNKQYFMLRLPPGKYVFDTQSMRGHLEIAVAAGTEHYLRVDQGNDCGDDDDVVHTDVSNPCEDKNASIESVPPERWSRDSRALKPIKSGDVRDRGLVTVPPGAPMTSGVQRSANQVGMFLSQQDRAKAIARMTARTTSEPNICRCENLIWRRTARRG